MNTSRRTYLWALVFIGSIWGLVEASVGVSLKGSCARFLSGSILLGTTMFFTASAYAAIRRKWLLLLLPFIASLFKLYSAFILEIPVISGAIINPIFAFFTEVVAFYMILLIIKPELLEHIYGQSALGAMAAVVAANLFPAVGMFTGISACILPGTSLPLALWGLPLAVALSAVTVPLGFGFIRAIVPVLSRNRATDARPVFEAYTALMICLSLWGIYVLYH